MGHILELVQRVTVFLLISTLVTDLFSGTEYKKYLQYAVGLILVVLVLGSVLELWNQGIEISRWEDLA